MSDDANPTKELARSRQLIAKAVDDFIKSVGSKPEQTLATQLHRARAWDQLKFCDEYEQDEYHDKMMVLKMREHAAYLLSKHPERKQ